MLVRSLSPFLMLLAIVCLFAVGNQAHAQTMSFSYQGRLLNGNYDFQFTLWDALTDGTQQPQHSPVTVTKTNVQVANGGFTVLLDFGTNAFPGADRYLEIRVRPTADRGSFTKLTPRQQIQDSNINSVSADKVSGGSSNYIKNTSTQQSNANFNISGNGTVAGTFSAYVVNAASQYHLGNARVLSSPGTRNLFAGIGAGQANTLGIDNAFFGTEAGQANTDGSENTFVGSRSGSSNIIGSQNAFFGVAAGTVNNGHQNSFFGAFAGFLNTTGRNNVFVGTSAGQSNISGTENSFFGSGAGLTNATGTHNSYFGSASTGADGLSNGTAIGALSYVSQSNSLILGAINGVNGATADTNVGIGTTAPNAKLQITSGDVYVQTPGNGIILRATNGPNCYRVTVNNAGMLSTALVPCP